MHETTWPVRGLPFAVIEWGAPDGAAPLLLLHGFLDHAGAWRPVAERLPGWRIAYDHRGHGRSPWAAPYDSYHFPDYVADLDAIVRRIGRPVRIIGHSMGATIATMYAGARPEQVEALVSVDGLGLHDGEAEAADRMQLFLEGVVRPPRTRAYASLEEAARRLRMAWPEVGEELADWLAERGTVAVPEGRAWSYDPRHKARSAVPYRHAHHLALLARIQCPVLAVHPGVATFQPRDIEALEAAIPRLTRITIPNTTHMIHLQAPAALAEACTAFLATVPPAPT